MDIFFTFFNEIYNLLCKYQESPKMSRKMFVEWYSQSLNRRSFLDFYNVELQNLIFCSKKDPISCYVIKSNMLIDNNELIETINHELLILIERFFNMKAFW